MSLHSNCLDCRMSSSFLDDVQGIWGVWFESDSYDLIFSPNSRALLPTFRTNCLDGSHFALLGSHFAQSTTQNPFSLLSSHKPVCGCYVRTQNTPKLTPKHTISWTELESGQINYCLGDLNPNWAKCLKSGPKKNIHQIHSDLAVALRSFHLGVVICHANCIDWIQWIHWLIGAQCLL